jgi:hypothetical protein
MNCLLSSATRRRNHELIIETRVEVGVPHYEVRGHEDSHLATPEKP